MAINQVCVDYYTRRLRAGAYLKEKAPVNDKTEVIITFLIEDEADKQKPLKLRMPGGLKGKGSIPDDFNNPIDDLKDYM